MVTTVSRTLAGARAAERRPLLVEVVGPAGAGKTTLAQALRQRNANILAGADLHLRGMAHIPFFARYALLLLSAFLGQYRNGRWFTWDEIKMMVYLTGWHRVLRRQASREGTVTILDHGPVFQLTQLHRFGPENISSQRFEKWWARVINQWAATLDMIIWLDTTDAVLLERIHARDRWHFVKEKSEQEAYQILVRYRTTYEQMMAALTADGGPRVLCFDTAHESLDQIVTQVLATFGLEKGEN